MHTNELAKARSNSGDRLAVGSRVLPLLVAGSLLVGVGCGSAEEVTAPAQPAQQTKGLVSGNGISFNGISFNGISFNGISFNGISFNGLTTAALTKPEFSTWFAANPENNDTLMRYMVRCGVKAQKTLTYTDPGTGKFYSWDGLLGLTPEWAEGHPITEREMQLMTACLAAHANKYGIHIPISVLGETAKDKKIHYTLAELQTFSRPEACFFGNLYQDEGMYVGSDRDQLDPSESSARACGLTSGSLAVASECAPMIHIGSCSEVCRLDKKGLYYESCTVNGKTYQPITTRLRPEDVYRCGDGVCQFTERCGTGTTWDSCYADCGACPSTATNSATP